MNRYRLGVMLLTALVLPVIGGAGKTSIVNTKHNLSVTGKGEIKSLGETRVCIFCHSSHNTSTEGPLWNHETTAPGKFKVYDRETLQAYPQQPNGATKLCLSCHDGTIAVGSVRSLAGQIAMQGVGARGEIPVHRKSNLGLDLSGTHPVSVPFKQQQSLAKASLRWPTADPEGIVGTDPDGFVQCTSCHDPHGSRSTELPFWNKETFSQVCDVCHTY